MATFHVEELTGRVCMQPFASPSCMLYVVHVTALMQHTSYVCVLACQPYFPGSVLYIYSYY